MKKITYLIYLTIACTSMLFKASAQTLPVGSCGIVYTYDASGNRINREYVCNNGFTGGNQQKISIEEALPKDVLKVDVLYPNPTTGYFTVKLVKPLSKATVTINEVSGRIILKKEESGSVLNYDLSNQPSGEYHLMINDGQHSVSIKIIKSK